MAIRLMAGAVLCALAGVASAEITEVTTTQTAEGLTDSSVWSDPTGFINPEFDYRTLGGTLKAPMSSFTFPGHALIIGRYPDKFATFGLRTSSNLVHEFTGDGGLVLSYASLDCWHGFCTTLKGKVTIEGSSKTPITMFAANNRASAASASIEFAGESFSGAETACAHTYIKGGETANGLSKDMVTRIISDTTDYLGTIRVSAYKDCTQPAVTNKYTTLQLGEHPFGGSIELHTGGVLAEVKAGYELSLKSLMMTNNAVLTLNWDGANEVGATYVVTDSLEVHAPVEIRPSATTTILKTKAMRHPLLKAPRGVKLNPADFKYVAATLFSEPTLEKSLPNVELVVEDDDNGLSTLWVVAREVITMLASDASNKTGSFVYDSSAPTNNWSNGEYPTGTYDYLDQGKTIRPPSGGTRDCVFGGHSLTLGNGVDTTVALRCRRLTIEDLRVDVSSCGVTFDNYGSGAKDYSFATEGTMYLAGNMYIGPKSTKDARRLFLVAYKGRMIAIESNISGDADIAARTSSDTKGFVQLSGDNSAWKGKLIAYGTGDGENLLMMIRFFEGRNLGGAMDEFTFNALELRETARLWPVGADVTVNEPTRGIYVKDGAEVQVDADSRLTIEERITYGGSFNKIGAGTLRLGGGKPLFTSLAQEEPMVSSNILNIAEGSLTPYSAEAFEGLVVNFAAGTSLTLEHPSALSADAKRYGMRLTHELSALNIADEQLTVNFAPTTKTGGGTVAICTVPATSASALRGKFDVPMNPYGDKREAKVVELDNGDGSVTFAVRIAVGLSLLIK